MALAKWAVLFALLAGSASAQTIMPGTNPTFGGTTVDGTHGLPVNCITGCSGGTASNASSGVATSSTNATTNAWNYGFNGSTWDQLQVDGSKNLKVIVNAALPVGANVIGALTANQSVNNAQVNGVTMLTGTGAVGTGAQRVAIGTDTATIAGSAPGTAGSASANVVTIQGITSMTKLLVTPDSVALPANQSVNLSQVNGTTPTEKAASTSPALTDTSLVVVQSPNPSVSCTTNIAINQTSSTDLHTFTSVGHICSIMLVSATAQSVSLIEGTGTVCASGTAAIIGGPSASMALAANGGFSMSNDRAVIKMANSADHLCLLQSGGGNVSGIITYQDHT